jgi:uncharacterized protein YdhG (YjbR/CyaY superfamily)
VKATNTATIDTYIADFPKETQVLLEKIRSIIRKAVPEATESICYSIPTFKLNNVPLIHFAAYKHHIGFYATPTGHEAFVEELATYKQGKGSVQFPLNQSIPFDLIERMVVFRRNQVLQK